MAPISSETRGKVPVSVMILEKANGRDQHDRSRLKQAIGLARHNRRPDGTIDPLPHAAEVSALPVRAAAIRTAQELIVQKRNLGRKLMAHLVLACLRQQRVASQTP